MSLSSRLSALTVWEASELLAARSIHADELLESQLDNIRRQNDELRAFITVFPGGERGRSGRGSLRGIPISIKDIINVKGKPTTAGSKVLLGYVPRVDATVISALKEAGATLTGKTNLHEFAFGVTNLNPHFGNCRNPWKKDRISGGSSGGGAVSVAAIEKVEGPSFRDLYIESGEELGQPAKKFRRGEEELERLCRPSR